MHPDVSSCGRSGGGKIVRVVGLADTLPLDPANPTAPLNRRISIIVLNKQAEAALRSGGKKLDVSSEEGSMSATSAQGLRRAPRPAVALKNRLP
jgi:chemotaxis protein MotB